MIPCIIVFEVNMDGSIYIINGSTEDGDFTDQAKLLLPQSQSTVDFILVWDSNKEDTSSNKSDKVNECALKRKTFERNLEKEGLILEYEQACNANEIFVIREYSI